MNNKKIIKRNAKLIVEKDNQKYCCIIEEIYDNGFTINAPIGNKKNLPLRTNDKVNFTLINKEDNSLYTFYAFVKNEFYEDRQAYYNFSEPFELIKIQRREFYRVTFYQDVKCYVLPEERHIDGMLVDISGKGAKIKFLQIKDLFKEGYLIIKFKILNNSYTQKARIVRINPVSKDILEAGVEFEEIQQREMDKIIRDLFNLERSRNL